MTLTIPTTTAEDRFDGACLLLDGFTDDEWAALFDKIAAGQFSRMSDAFTDTCNEAFDALSMASSQWGDRHEPDGDLYRAGHSSFGYHHPDSLCFGGLAA